METFGRLAVIEEVIALRTAKHRFMRCRCACGTYRIVLLNNLRRGHTRSCGCLHREVVAARRLAHGHTRQGRRSAEYAAWRGIKTRCFNRNEPSWANYGGRGITMCAEWVNSFETFVRDVGARPSARYSIDRINNDGNYEPDNVRWATRSEQARNRRPVQVCKNGHPFDYIKPSGQRCCRQCKRELLRAWRKRQQMKSVA